MLHATQCPQRETGRDTSEPPLRSVPSKARGPASGRAAPTARVRPRKHPAVRDAFDPRRAAPCRAVRCGKQAGERGTRIEVAQLVTSHHIIRQPLAAPTRRHQQARAAVAPRVVPRCPLRAAAGRQELGRAPRQSRTGAHGPGPASRPGSARPHLTSSSAAATSHAARRGRDRRHARYVGTCPAPVESGVEPLGRASGPALFSHVVRLDRARDPPHRPPYSYSPVSPRARR